MHTVLFSFLNIFLVFVLKSNYGIYNEIYSIYKYLHMYVATSWPNKNSAEQYIMVH